MKHFFFCRYYEKHTSMAARKLYSIWNCVYQKVPYARILSKITPKLKNAVFEPQLQAKELFP